MKTDIQFATATLLVSDFDGDPCQLGTEAGRFVAMTLPCESEGATGEDYGNALRIRDTWNACHGLDLPADVEPGILALAVNLLRNLDLWEQDPDACNSDAADLACDAREILAKLAPAGSPDTGTPVSTPEPEKPRLPEVIERAIRHAQSVCPSIDRVTFWEEQWWCFADDGGNEKIKSFPPGLDTQPFEDALDYVYENGGFPQSFQLANTMA